jgi:hypothetical protein
VTDLQVSLTSLEEVFLNIAKNAEIEDARNTGNVIPVDVPLSDGTVLKVLQHINVMSSEACWL